LIDREEDAAADVFCDESEIFSYEFLTAFLLTFYSEQRYLKITMHAFGGSSIPLYILAGIIFCSIPFLVFCFIGFWRARRLSGGGARETERGHRTS
jgi:hypothetical protein